MTTVNLLRAEFYKIKNSMILLVLSGLVLFWVSLSMVNFYLLTYQKFLYKAYPSGNINPWFSYYFEGGYFILLAFFLPLVVSLIVFFVKSIEDKAEGWKRLMVLPFSPFRLHMSKLLVIWACILGLIIILFFLFFVSGNVLSWLKPDFKFDQYPSYHYYLLCFALKYCAFSLTVSSLCYLILLLIKRYALTLAAVVLLPTVGQFAIASKFNPFFAFMASLWEFLSFRSRYMSDNDFLVKKEELFTYPMFTPPDVVNLVSLVVIIIVIYFVSKKILIYHE